VNKPLVVVTSPVFPETVAFLAQHCTLERNEQVEPWPYEEVRRRCANAEGLLAFMTDKVDAAFLDHCPSLRVIACALKGWDNFDIEACARKGLWVTAVPDLLTEPTAELALLLALALGRNLLQGDRLVRTGSFRGWRAQLYGSGLAGSTIGIAGAGRVGRAIAARLAGFAPARILYYDRMRLDAAEERSLRMEHAGWDELLVNSDTLFLALPLTDDTHHLMNRDALQRIRPGCLVVNAGRGSVADECAVADALREGRLGGYAADVFEFEDWARPGRRRDVPHALLAHPQTVFTPHLGSAVVDVRRRIELAAAHNLAVALSGHEPPDVVARPQRKETTASAD
jgi:phosphonate dehydrogenase